MYQEEKFTLSVEIQAIYIVVIIVLFLMSDNIILQIGSYTLFDQIIKSNIHTIILNIYFMKPHTHIISVTSAIVVI